MRINLNCPFPEKDQAKALGARWDGARKTWYIVDVEDLTPFMRWIGHKAIEKAEKHEASPHVQRQRAKVREKMLTPITTYPECARLVSTCGCTEMAPWEDCEHTACDELDADQAEHMRAICG